MKSMIRNIADGDRRYPALAFVCPGCIAARPGSDGLHMLPVNTDQASPAWGWDGSIEAPTISPSIKTEGGNPAKPYVCHSFLRAGVFEFLSDCTHPLAGQHVPLPDLPEWFVREEAG